MSTIIDRSYESLAPVAVPGYLASYGYVADNETCWTPLPAGFVMPQFDLQVSGHQEMDSHTIYFVDCNVILSQNGVGPATKLTWRAEQRLVNLREHVHDRVKQDFGRSYTRYFGAAHFAHRGGVRGTTARLNAWFAALASCINGGMASPAVVALTLHFLGAPEQEAKHDGHIDIGGHMTASVDIVPDGKLLGTASDSSWCDSVVSSSSSDTHEANCQDNTKLDTMSSNPFAVDVLSTQGSAESKREFAPFNSDQLSDEASERKHTNPFDDDVCMHELRT